MIFVEMLSVASLTHLSPGSCFHQPVVLERASLLVTGQARLVLSEGQCVLDWTLAIMKLGK